MNEIVEVVFVAGTEIYEGLDCLVGVGRNILTLSSFDYDKHVVRKSREVGNAVINIGGFVDTNKRFIENGEEVTEQLKCDRLNKMVRDSV